MNRENLKSTAVSINENQLEQYLISSGWVNDGILGNIASIWHHLNKNLQDAELLLPRKGLALDFSDRIVDLIIQLSIYENRAPADLLTAISNFSADLIRVRVIHDDVEGGTIPLEDGVLLHEKARDLMLSAALSTMSKKKQFPSNRPPETTEYINRLRLGQTELGSYVINIIAPLEQPSLNQETIDTTTFSRMVTYNLATGLNALNGALSSFSNGSDISIFDATVERGVSINLCEALIGLTGFKKHRSFVISVTPSLTQKMPSDELQLEFEFGAKTVPTLEKIIEFFKESYVLPDRTITGQVKRLDRTPNSNAGVITVTCNIKDSEKNVTIELEEHDYIEAIHAHEQKQIVKCIGDLHVSPRSAKLLSPHDFLVIRNGDLF